MEGVHVKHLLNQFEVSPFGPPNAAGVYLVCVRTYLGRGEYGRERILYIGQSRDIKSRVMPLQHPYRKIYDRFKDHLVYTKHLITENRKSIEWFLITELSPLLNIQSKIPQHGTH